MTTTLPRYIWAIVAAFALTLSLATPAAAASQTITLVDDRAFDDGECGVLIRFDDQTELIVIGTWTSKTSSSGNFTYTCKGQIDGAAPAQAIKIADPSILAPCRNFEQGSQRTPNWDLHITPTGKATYSCQYKAN